MSKSIMTKGSMKTPNYDTEAASEKEAQDRSMFGSTGGDGECGNGPCTASASLGHGDGGARTTGNGSGHWSGR